MSFVCKEVGFQTKDYQCTWVVPSILIYKIKHAQVMMAIPVTNPQ